MPLNAKMTGSKGSHLVEVKKWESMFLSISFPLLLLIQLMLFKITHLTSQK